MISLKKGGALAPAWEVNGMKGTKTRVWVLLAALLLLAGCGKNNPSVLQLPDSTAAAQSGAESTPAPLKALGDRTCRVGQETIPESTLFSFVLNEAAFDPQQGLTLKLTSVNKSSVRDFVVSLPYLSVNGYMQDADYEARVPAGQTVAGEIEIPADDLRRSGVSSVDELILYPLIYDDAVAMGQGDVVDGAFSFYPTGQSKGNVVYPVRQKGTNEQIFFDNGFGSMILLDARADEQDEDNVEVTGYLENKTDRFLSFAWTDVSMNGAAINGAGDTVVAPGMRCYITMFFSVPSQGSNGNELSFKVTATPLSNDGSTVAPLMEQRGTYRFGTTAGAVATPDAGIEPGDEPVAAATATPAPTTIIYTTPTSAQKKNAKNGYVNKDKVNLRSGPGTKYKTVGTKIEQNTAVTLYELQDGWWFLKCGKHYGYVKADYISQGKPKATAAAESDGKTFAGTVNTNSKAALRKSADTGSKCLKELSGGDKVTVYYKTKGADGHTWYYVSYGGTKGYIRSDLVKVSGKVPSK